jgi:hypothetical protein
MEVLFEPGHQAMQEAPVLADRIAAHRRRIGRDPFGHERKRARFRISHADALLQHAPPQPRLAVLVPVPFVHRLQCRERMGDRELRPFGEDVELRIGDDRGDLDDRITVRIQTCHLQVDPDQASFAVRTRCHGIPVVEGSGNGPECRPNRVRIISQAMPRPGDIRRKACRACA